MNKKLLAVALLSAFSASAVASDFYIGAKAGTVNYGYSNITNNGQTGMGVFGGYQISKTYSVEAEYANLGGFDQTGGTWKGSSIGVNGVGTFELGESWALIGKIGISTTSLTPTAKPGYTYTGASSISNTGVTLGFAGQYNISSAFGVRAGVDAYPVGDSTTTTSNATLLSIGGVFKF